MGLALDAILAQLRVPQLRAMLKNHGIPIGRKRRADMLAAIREFRLAQSPEPPPELETQRSYACSENYTRPNFTHILSQDLSSERHGVLQAGRCRLLCSDSDGQLKT